MIWSLTRDGSYTSGLYAVRRNTRGGFSLSHRHRLLIAECASAAIAKDAAQAHAVKEAAAALRVSP